MSSSFKPVRSGDLLAAQSAAGVHRLVTTRSSFQAVAAAAATPADFLTLAMRPLVGVVGLDVNLEAALGTGESITYTVSRFNTDGTFTTIATAVVDDTATVGLNNVKSGVLSISLKEGDILLVARAYVAGGGPTAPGNALTIQVE